MTNDPDPTIQLPPPPPPGANYVPARQHGDLLFIAGQLPFVDGRLPRTGKLGDSVDVPAGQHLVAKGASDVLIAVLGERGRHARTAVATPVLPLDTPVEVQLVLGLDHLGTTGGNA